MHSCIQYVKYFDLLIETISWCDEKEKSDNNIYDVLDAVCICFFSGV
jgi:hypothetical protein